MSKSTQKPVRIKHQLKDGIMRRMMKIEHYRICLFNDLRPDYFPVIHDVSGLQDRTIYRFVTEGIADDVCLLAEHRFLLLVEFQSTIYHGMDYRILEYWMEIMKMYASQTKYSARSNRNRLPVPYFVIVYTGKDKTDITRFCQAFTHMHNAVKIQIKLITDGNAKGVVKEYIDFCQTWDRYRQRMPNEWEKAARKTIHECLARKILTELISTIGKEEMITMMTYEQLAQMHIRNDIYQSHRDGIRKGEKRGLKKGRQEGLQEGRKEGIQEGRKEGIQEGRKEGIQEGRKEGIQEGRKEGIQEGEDKMIARLLQNMMDGSVSRTAEALDLDEQIIRRAAEKMGIKTRD